MRTSKAFYCWSWSNPSQGIAQEWDRQLYNAACRSPANTRCTLFGICSRQWLLMSSSLEIRRNSRPIWRFYCKRRVLRLKWLINPMTMEAWWTILWPEDSLIFKPLTKMHPHSSWLFCVLDQLLDTSRGIHETYAPARHRVLCQWEPLSKIPWNRYWLVLTIGRGSISPPEAIEDEMRSTFLKPKVTKILYGNPLPGLSIAERFN